MYIPRVIDERRVRAALERSPVVVLTGLRQAGKSTLAKQLVDLAPSNVFDLEDPRDLARLGDPTASLPRLEGTVLIDEAQRSPEIFPILRVLVDERREAGRFLVLGSASPNLIGMAAESLAGRSTVIELPGLRLVDVGERNLDALWRRGGLPPSYDAPDDESTLWRDDYISTFLERDLANLGIRFPPTALRRFWTMTAHYHGQTWNGAELSRALGISQPTVRRYLDALTDALVVRQLQPWFANISKRQVKSPKVYIRDTGLLHRLLGIGDEVGLLGHPKVAASWEGFVIEQLVTLLDVRDPSFWRTQAGAELDLRVEFEGRLLGVEVKRSARPTMTASIRSAVADLELDHLYVVHGGDSTFALDDRVTALAAHRLLVDGSDALC